MFVDEAQAFTKVDSEVVATLKAARALIQDPKNWTIGSYCISLGGSHNDLNTGVQFCAVGALAKATNTKLCEIETRPIVHFMENVVKVLYAGKTHPVQVNDTLGHAAVMQMFDVAIEKAEREGL